MKDPKIMKIRTYHYVEELRKAYEARAPIEMFGTTYKIVEISYMPGGRQEYTYILNEVE